MSIIQPRVLKGFRDCLPDEMIPKQKMIKNLVNTFSSFGFNPIDTPSLEYTEILLGKGSGETDKQLYRFQDHGGRDVALRFDLTIPLARFIAQNYHKITFPFKRFHIAQVWRGENTQKGRFREFYQCDFDILGSDTVQGDFEIVFLIATALHNLKINDFLICINHRNLLNALLQKLDLVDKSTIILRIIDKLPKIGQQSVVDALQNEASIPESVCQNIIQFISLKGKKDIIEKCESILKNIGKSEDDSNDQIPEKGKKAISDLEKIITFFQEVGLEENIIIDLSIARGLDYYTGLVFETILKNNTNYGSICSGGRYENLVSLYSKSVVSGVGASIGLDRLCSALEDRNELGKEKSVSQILIFNLDDQYSGNYQNLANSLRKKGFNTEVFLNKRKLDAQFKYAEKLNIPIGIFAGETEIKTNTYALKNLKTRDSYDKLSLEDLEEKIRHELEKNC